MRRVRTASYLSLDRSRLALEARQIELFNRSPDLARRVIFVDIERSQNLLAAVDPNVASDRTFRYTLLLPSNWCSRV